MCAPCALRSDATQQLRRLGNTRALCTGASLLQGGTLLERSQSYFRGVRWGCPPGWGALCWCIYVAGVALGLRALRWRCAGVARVAGVALGLLRLRLLRWSLRVLQASRWRCAGVAQTWCKVAGVAGVATCCLLKEVTFTSAARARCCRRGRRKAERERVCAGSGAAPAGRRCVCGPTLPGHQGVQRRARARTLARAATGGRAPRPPPGQQHRHTASVFVHPRPAAGGPRAARPRGRPPPWALAAPDRRQAGARGVLCVAGSRCSGPGALSPGAQRAHPGEPTPAGGARAARASARQACGSVHPIVTITLIYIRPREARGARGGRA